MRFWLTLFLVWNILFNLVLPSSAYVRRSFRRRASQGKLQKQSRSNHIDEGYIVMTPYYPPISQSPYHIQRFDRVSQFPDFKKIAKRQKNICNGKEKLLDDIGALAIVTGGIGTVMGIFSAAYYSLMGNVISIISTIISHATAIPSAIITYLATTDRLTYAIANFLSLIGIANTFYGQWSIDLGNKDIALSTAANGIGVFSLILSIVSGFEEVFDSVVEGFRRWLGRKVVDDFVNGYRCDENDYWGEMFTGLSDLRFFDLF